MRLGVFSVLDSYPGAGSRRVRDRYEETVRLARVTEAVGLDAFWVAEHHFQQGGTLPAPPVFLAAIARETVRIRLGALVAVLPLHDPRQLAEEYLVLDRLAHGRVEVGVGSGYVPLEFDGFGLEVGRRHVAFDRARPQFEGALAGTRWTTPNGKRVQVNVAPVRPGGPPLWVAASRRALIRAVGARGGRLALVPYATLGRLDELKGMLREYRAELPPRAVPRVLVALHLYVGPRPAAARRALQRFLDTRAAPDSALFRARLAKDPELRTAAGLESRGLAWIGTSHRLRQDLAALEAWGVTDLAGIFDFGDLPFPEAAASITRFAAAAGRWRRPLLPSASARTELWPATGSG